MPRGIIERGSWQIHVVALISQCPHLKYLTMNVLLIAPVKKVEILRLSTHYGYSSVLVTYLCGRTKVLNACSVTTDGHQAPTANYVILTKRGKKRPDFTPSVRFIISV